MIQDADAESRNWQGAQTIPRHVFLDNLLPMLRVQPAADVLSGLLGEQLFSYSTADEPLVGSVFHNLPVSGLQIYLETSATITCIDSILNFEGWEFGVQARR